MAEKKPRQEDVEALMKSIEGKAAPAPPPEGAGMEYAPLAVTPGTPPEGGIELLRDVNVQVRVELGRSRMYVQDILRLAPGSVVPLDSATTEPVDVYVNDRLVARGEVVVVNDNFAVRITEVVPSPKGPAA